MVQILPLLYSTVLLWGPVHSLALPNASPHVPASSLRVRYGSGDSKVIYLMTNKAPVNSIIAIPVAGDGRLSPGVLTATGGAGGNLLNAMTGIPGAPDALSVQDSVVVAGDYLFNVNAGSNTVSMFAINPRNPTQLTRLGKPMSSNGDFPVSLAASLSLKKVCVANTGLPTGVSCASFNGFTGLSAFDALRSFDIGQTNPPTGPINGVGDLLFNGDDSILVLMMKGNGMANHTGFVATFPVKGGSISREGKQYKPPGLALEFGSTPIPGTKNLILSSQGDFGSVVLDLDNLNAPPTALTNVTGQAASCWAEVSTFTGTGFITDVGKNRLVETDLKSGAILTEYYPPNPNPGMSDFKTAGTKIWVLSAGNGTTPASVVVFDISGGRGSAKQVQNFAVPGADLNAMGLAMYQQWWV